MIVNMTLAGNCSGMWSETRFLPPSSQCIARAQGRYRVPSPHSEQLPWPPSRWTRACRDGRVAQRGAAPGGALRSHLVSSVTRRAADSSCTPAASGVLKQAFMYLGGGIGGGRKGGACGARAAGERLGTCVALAARPRRPQSAAHPVAAARRRTLRVQPDGSAHHLAGAGLAPSGRTPRGWSRLRATGRPLGVLFPRAEQSAGGRVLLGWPG